MKKVSLQNENRVADTCWGYHGTDTRLYCDLEGEGWASFQIADGACALSLINVQYHTDSNNSGAADDGDIGVPLPTTDPKYKELNDILLKSGGGEGNPYKGMGITVTPNDPKPEWS